MHGVKNKHLLQMGLRIIFYWRPLIPFSSNTIIVMVFVRSRLIRNNETEQDTAEQIVTGEVNADLKL
jgi:hypothetical protein